VGDSVTKKVKPLRSNSCFTVEGKWEKCQDRYRSKMGDKMKTEWSGMGLFV
jgi:hypothetical protein